MHFSSNDVGLNVWQQLYIIHVLVDVRDQRILFLIIYLHSDPCMNCISHFLQFHRFHTVVRVSYYPDSSESASQQW